MIKRPSQAGYRGSRNASRRPKKCRHAQGLDRNGRASDRCPLPAPYAQAAVRRPVVRAFDNLSLISEWARNGDQRTSQRTPNAREAPRAVRWLVHRSMRMARGGADTQLVVAAVDRPNSAGHSPLRHDLPEPSAVRSNRPGRARAARASRNGKAVWSVLIGPRSRPIVGAR
jgi:hypothetical protein